jgi:diacylglycerol kinase family enzyme
MKIAIVINPLRLTPELKAKLESGELTKKYNIDYDIFNPAAAELENTFNQLNYESYNACLVCGGDGTVRTAAQILQNHHLPMAILPLGTFNVLAKSMGYPNNLDELFNIIKNKKTKVIDIADINGEIFINHAWLGFYYIILKMREKHKTILGKSRLLKTIFSAFFMFKRIPIYEFEVKIEDTVASYKTCLIFISNSESSSQWSNFGVRPLLSTGRLYVNILNCFTRWQLFFSILTIILTDFKNSKYITQFIIDELTITSNHKNANIVLDGELFTLDCPLHFTNQKHQLIMIAP